MASAQRVLSILSGEKHPGESYAACVLRLIAASRESAADLALMRSERDAARVQRDGASEAMHLVTKELSATSDLLAKQIEITTEIDGRRTAAIAERHDAIKAATEAREVMKRERVAHEWELWAEKRRSGLAGLLFGSAVGLVVASLVCAVFG
jgi:hypothetical protein